MDEMEIIKQTFFQECEDLLQELENGLIRLKNGDVDGDTIDAIFRAVHSIKGVAGAFSLTDLVNFSHVFENVLDDLRSDRLEGSEDIYETLLESSDILNDLVAAARDNQDWDTSQSESLLKRLKILSSKDSADDSVGAADIDEDFGFEPVGLALDLDLGFAPDGDDSQSIQTPPSISIYFKPEKRLFENGHSITRLFRHLAEFGELEVDCDHSALADFDMVEAEVCYLAWRITVQTDHSKDEILEVFDFVIDDCDLKIEVHSSLTPLESGRDLLPIGSPVDSPIQPFVISPLETVDTGSTAKETPVIAPLEAEPLTPQLVTPEPVKDVSTTPKKAAEAKKAPPATIRINLERVDRLINQVGELVINQAMLTQSITDTDIGKSPDVISTLDEFKQLTRDIQDSVMAIRAQPVQPLFQRMSRIVREAAQATDKKANLILEGEFTEVDKTIIEKLADPLTHMIRNAIDHGLETPAAREAAGKTPNGNIILAAAHRSGKIIIEVSDDGAGINRDKVKSLAIAKDLISPDVILSDGEIDNLLFLPGFSTVDKVSTLSGSGVGMDVVKRAIQSFGGRISIASHPGKGSKFTISLPLTLAVLDGMLVEVGAQTLVIPLTSIVETLLPKPGDIHDMSPSGQVINVRGVFMPLIDLGKKLDFRDTQKQIKNPIVLCVETEDGMKYALMADAIQDQRQVVIKSLEDNYGQVPYIAAATILGDGRIALIADIDEIIRSDTPPLTAAAPTPTLELAHA